MTSLPPFAVTVNAKKRACIIDTSLALSRYGLLLSKRLGEEFNLWLVRELWQILDNTHYYLAHPEKLMMSDAGPGTGKGNGRVLEEALAQWDLVRTETDHGGRQFYWIADALGESYLPAGSDRNLAYRFDVLGASLDRRLTNGRNRDLKTKVIVDCFRDAAALTVALMSSGGFILTLNRRDGDGQTMEEPFICSCLRDWGVNVHEITGRRTALMEQELLLNIFARSGVAELLWAGLDLAAVHIVAPRAVMFSPANNDEEGLMGEFAMPEDDYSKNKEDWWEEAVCIWYPVNA